MNRLEQLRQLRAAYADVRDRLPWLDASVWEEEAPAFPKHAHRLATSSVKAASRLDRGVQLLRYDPQNAGPLDVARPLLARAAAASVPLVARHTDVDLPGIESLAAAMPKLTIIIESGPRKILYLIAQIEDLLSRCANVYLSTYNFCNWQALEEFCRKGLGAKLLYGSHAPGSEANVAMGPIVMGRLSWTQKCAIAGNNLRRLLNLPLVSPAEVVFKPPPPFVVDAHAHNVNAGEKSPWQFPLPDQRMAPADWTEFMDHVAVERLLLAPAESLLDPARTGEECSASLRRHAPERFGYFETFHPKADEQHRQRLAASLASPACVGIKIHPSLHETAADDASFDFVYELAGRFKKPILTHSWEVSSYNPVQYLSHPDRFRRHLERHPEARLALGHAGGRPSTIESVTALCRDFPNVVVDIAGDYFDNGLIETLVERLTPGKVLFGSDADWIDPRCNLAAVLGSGLSDEHALSVLRENALRFYGYFLR